MVKLRRNQLAKLRGTSWKNKGERVGEAEVETVGETEGKQLVRLKRNQLVKLKRNQLGN